MKKVTKYILIILILVFIIFTFFSLKRTDLIDDFIIFKLFSDSNVNLEKIKKEKLNLNNSKEYPIYEFNVSYKKTKLEGINLLDTIDNKTLVKEKVAPGTKGNFTIRIKSNEDINYEILFNSLNEKPKNLIFEYKNIKYQKLEDLQKGLIGKIAKKETIDINISWEWEYKISSKEDTQDTKDGEKLKNYNFTIETIGIK